jgi:UDP-glucose:(heptosyl)LPS alpha-1,3-glucosyltransferase
LKVALVILHADPARGGAERYTFDLAQALGERGVDVSLVASSFGSKPAGLKVVQLDRRGLTRLGQYRRFLRSLDAHLAETQYDIVHAMLPVHRCDVYHPHAGVAAEAIVSGHRKHSGGLTQGVAAVSNRLNVKRRAFANVERALLTAPKPPIVLCLSEYVKGTVRAHYALAEDRLATLFNAVDLAKFDPGKRPECRSVIRTRFGIAPGRTVGLMIAQDFARKGLEPALRALVRVAERPVLVVVGKEDPSAYRRMAEEMGIAGDVVFAGPTTDPYAFYTAADFFILPTRHDPCSLVVLESLAMGLPVISTKQNGACEIMTPGEQGFVLDSADEGEALVAAMTLLCDDRTRGVMREKCLALRPRLAYGTHLRRLLEVYERARVRAAD